MQFDIHIFIGKGMDVWTLQHIIKSAGFNIANVTREASNAAIPLQQRKIALRKTKDYVDTQPNMVIAMEAVNEDILPLMPRPPAAANADRGDMIASICFMSSFHLVYPTSGEAAILAFLKPRKCEMILPCMKSASGRAQCGQHGLHVTCHRCGFTTCMRCTGFVRKRAPWPSGQNIS